MLTAYNHSDHFACLPRINHLCITEAHAGLCLSQALFRQTGGRAFNKTLRPWDAHNFPSDPRYVSLLRSRLSFLIPGGVPVLLSPGIHSFPFKLGLPLGLPSTFLGKHGWVQYYCKTALKEANSGLAHKNQQVFIVMNPIDLNQEPAILAVSRY